MQAQAAVYEAPWRAKLQAALVIAIAIIGLVAAVVLLYIDRHDASELSAYNSASACAAPVDAMGSEACRYQGQARIVSTWMPDIRRYAQVSFDSMPGRTLTTSWPSKTEPDPAVLKPGVAIDAELWSGKVTRLGGTITVDSPQNIASGLWELSAFFGVLGLPLLGFGVYLARAAWRGQPTVVVAASTPIRLADRTRYAIIAGVFVVIGTPASLYILINGRSGTERAFGVFSGVVLLAFAARLGWLAWRAR